MADNGFGDAGEEKRPPSPEFVVRALRAGDPTAAKARVASCSVEQAAGPGDNFLGDLWRVRVRLADESGETQERALVVKRLPTDEVVREFVRRAGLYDVETSMYRHTLPVLEGLLETAFGGSFRPFWPRFFLADGDALVMEDLCAGGFAPADKRQGLDLAHTRAVLRNLALFHAASVAMHVADPASVEPYRESLFRESTREYLETYLRGSARELAARVRTWPGYGDMYAERIAALEKNAWTRVSAAAARDDAAFNVLNHGDLWVNNVLFCPADEGSPEPRAAFVDLQNAVWTSPALDLLYFLYTSPSDEVREHHEEALVELYHGTLRRAMEALGVGARAPSLAGLRDDLRKRFALALYPVVCELPNMMAPSHLYYDISQYFLAEPPPNRAYDAQSYARVVRRLLPLLEARGAL